MISFDKFRNWAETRFGDIIVKGDEIKINSIFETDYKHHMWCNPTGGKVDCANGVYHCWKSGKSGSLVSLVQKVDKCSYEEALERLGGVDADLIDLERRLEQFFAFKNKEPKTIVGDAKFPESTIPIKSLSSGNFWRVEAEAYLENRKLDPDEYLICIEGEYKNRIIIPYYDQEGKLIYWNARFMNDSKLVAKYLGPKVETFGVGKEDVIYMASGWPQAGKEVYITEGEFDAKSLYISGSYAAAIGGKAIGDKQVEMLRPYIPVLAFDADSGTKDAGGTALVDIGNKLKQKGFDEVFFARPPKKYKDWNKMLVEVGPKIIQAYLGSCKKPYTIDTGIELSLNRF